MPPVRPIVPMYPLFLSQRRFRLHVEDADRCIMRRDLGSRRCFAVTLQPHVVGNLRHGDGLVLILGPSRSPLYAGEIEEMTESQRWRLTVIKLGSAEVDSRERRSGP